MAAGARPETAQSGDLKDYDERREKIAAASAEIDLKNRDDEGRSPGCPGRDQATSQRCLGHRPDNLCPGRGGGRPPASGDSTCPSFSDSNANRGWIVAGPLPIAEKQRSSPHSLRHGMGCNRSDADPAGAGRQARDSQPVGEPEAK